MSRSILCAAAMAALTGLISVSADAAQFTVKFDGTDGETTNLHYGYGQGGSNTGLQQGQLLLTPPSVDWYFPASLLRVKSVPADFVGATINSATLTLNDNWGTTSVYQGVEIHRVDTPVTWKPGDGQQSDRWPNLGRKLYDNGAGRRVADWTGIDAAVDGSGIGRNEGAGYDWNGNPVGASTANQYYQGFSTLPGFEDAALKDLITTIRLVGPSSTDTLLAGETRGVASADLTSLVAHWADGSWDMNDGFAFWMGNATKVSTGSNTHGWVTTGSEGGLVIDYTPVNTPEPASLGILALGGLILARRRA